VSALRAGSRGAVRAVVDGARPAVGPAVSSAVDDEVRERLATLGPAVVELAAAIEAGDALGALGLQV